VLRRLAGLSQRQLAAKSGVPQSRIAEAESGAQPLSPQYAIKMAPVLREDPVELYVSTTVASIKAQIERGEARPVKAAHIARALIAIIESGDLSTQQRAAARNAARELVDLATEAAEKAGAGTLTSVMRGPGSGGPGPANPPQREQEHREAMAELGRDMTGRALGRDGLPLRKKPKTRPLTESEAQPGSDATYAYKGEPRLPELGPMSDLGRDAFGRRIDPA